MKRWLFASLIFAAIAMVAAACGGDDNDELTAEVAALRAEVAQTRMVAEEALIRASLPALDGSRFHAMEVRISDAGHIDPDDPGFLQRALQVLNSAGWPAALRPNVEQLRAAVRAAAAPVLDNDAETAGPLMRIAHASAHDFEGAVAAYFAGEAIPPPPDIDISDVEPMEAGADDGAGEHAPAEDDTEDDHHDEE